jgi:N-formylglutamate amidohydrolase
MELFVFEAGDTPLVIDVPHAGCAVPADIRERLSPSARPLPDTDWFVDKLYAFASGLGASMQVATHSRYVVDLNRPPDDTALYPGREQSALVPTRTFDGKPVYLPGKAPDEEERAARVSKFWRPYHDHLARHLEQVRGRFGFCVLWDAHAIRTEGASLFAGPLPDLNIGTNGGKSCDPGLTRLLADRCADLARFDHVVDGRFKGGYVTRHYGRPGRGYHAVQLELAQAIYMEETQTARFEPDRAAVLMSVLERLLGAVLRWCDDYRVRDTAGEA